MVCEDRAKVEDFLTEQGVKVNRNYGKGGRMTEIAVSYFKAWHHDE